MDRVSGGGEPFLLGVNYWPRAKAMYWWADFDPGEVREEFAMIRALGLGHVRIFLLWESFQPRPDVVDATALRDLRTVADIAAETGLKIEPTFFTGHMSGPNWAPDWLLDASRPLRPGDRQVVSLGRPTAARHDIHNPYVEPFVLDAERLQLRTVCGALRDHPAIWAWSLGNEPDLFARPPNADAGRAWMADMVATIRDVDPDHPVLIGLHGASVHADVGLRIDHAAAETDISVMHGYSIYDSLAREPLDPDLVPFTAALTAALAGRPILFEEFGVNTQLPDGPSHWEELPLWDGGTRQAYFASEADGADVLRGSAGAAASARLPSAPSPGASGTTPKPSGTGRRATSRSTSASSASIAPMDRSSRWARSFATSRHQRPPCAGRSGRSCCRSHPTTSTPIPSATSPTCTRGSSPASPIVEGGWRGARWGVGGRSCSPADASTSVNPARSNIESVPM